MKVKRKKMKMLRKEIDKRGMEKFVPEGYEDRVELMPQSRGSFYTPFDFENGLEILLYFSRAGRQNLNPDSIKRCIVTDVNAKRYKSGYGIRDALGVKVNEAWIIRWGSLERVKIRNPDVKFLYESIKGAYRILE